MDGVQTDPRCLRLIHEFGERLRVHVGQKVIAKAAQCARREIDLLHPFGQGDHRLAVGLHGIEEPRRLLELVPRLVPQGEELVHLAHLFSESPNEAGYIVVAQVAEGFVTVGDGALIRQAGVEVRHEVVRFAASRDGAYDLVEV